MSQPSANIFGTYVAPQSDYIDARVLGVNSAESHTIPSNAKYVLFSATDDFYCLMDGTPSIPSADVEDGSAPELNPTLRDIQSASAIGLISPRACVVTMSFYY